MKYCYTIIVAASLGIMATHLKGMDDADNYRFSEHREMVSLVETLSQIRQNLQQLPYTIPTEHTHVALYYALLPKIDANIQVGQQLISLSSSKTEEQISPTFADRASFRKNNEIAIALFLSRVRREALIDCYEELRFLSINANKLLKAQQNEQAAIATASLSLPSCLQESTIRKGKRPARSLLGVFGEKCPRTSSSEEISAAIPDQYDILAPDTFSPDPEDDGSDNPFYHPDDKQ